MRASRQMALARGRKREKFCTLPDQEAWQDNLVGIIIVKGT